MSSSESTLPHWDMSVVYPGLESAEFEEDFRSVVRSIGELVDLFDRHGISQQAPTSVDETTVQVFETVVERYNSVLEEIYTLSAYIRSFITTDSRNELAQARWSEFQQQAVRLSMLGTRFTAWIGSFDVGALIERSSVAGEHAFMLRKAKKWAAHLMTLAEEELATELNLTGGTAWAKLYGTFTSQLMVTVELDGKAQQLPMSAVRNLAHDPDRDVRRRAYEAELDTWERSAVPITAAFNSIKGEVNALTTRRGWDSPLEVALFDNHIDRRTLDAMMEAAHDSFPDFRRYLRAKARVLGLSTLTWYDLFAPVGEGDREWSFEDAAQFIIEQFGTYSAKLSGLAERAFHERWIDAEPRPGKRDGAFCMRLRKDESRILANYKPTFGAVSTLAHELGHAYHNLNLAQRTVLQRATPMTLAETASIFCDTIVQQTALDQADPQDQLTILEASLQGACQVVVDITSRFLFEHNVFEKRRHRELSAEELNQLMLEAQRQTYGEGLDPDALHPYMWAVKPHYYSAGFSFYNFPYMFGLLFGLGLYAHYQDDPERFKVGYDELLSSTGLGEAADLAARFGIDIRTSDFWRSSLSVIRADIDRFESLIAG
ncbi:MAG: M3 family oligoendopeptidase [Candidatus Bipolaricaulia bacterium]